MTAESENGVEELPGFVVFAVEAGAKTNGIGRVGDFDQGVEVRQFVVVVDQELRARFKKDHPAEVGGLAEKFDRGQSAGGSVNRVGEGRGVGFVTDDRLKTEGSRVAFALAGGEHLVGTLGEGDI